MSLPIAAGGRLTRLLLSRCWLVTGWGALDGFQQLHHGMPDDLCAQQYMLNNSG